MSVFSTNGEHYHESTELVEVQTYKSIGRDWGVCWQRVRQIEKRAMKKIRQALEKEAAARGVSVREWLFGNQE